ncbi:MAG TPA: hypothetical protein VHK65_03890 [Candidatus Dormibacteraeota bacterium]|nr:hypothetical protein [Candidatus Dormibacteraeota bacterium]
MSVIAAPSANETVLYRSSAQFWVWSNAEAKLRGFAIGSTAFMAGFFTVALLRKWNAQRAKWRQIDDGWVELTTERIRLQSAGEVEAGEAPYGTIREIRYEGDRVAVNLMVGDQFKIRPTDAALFRTTLEQVARPKLWRALPLEQPTSQAPVVQLEQRAGAFSFGIPAGWTLVADLQKASSLLHENVVAAVVHDIGSVVNPNVRVAREAGPVRRDDLERLSCAFPSLIVVNTPGGEVIGPPRRLDIGGEMGIAATIRFPSQDLGGPCRIMRIRIARAGIPYNIEFMADDRLFDTYLPGFEAMLANWTWRDKAPAISKTATPRAAATSGGLFRKRLLPAFGLFLLSSISFSQSSRTQAATGTVINISTLGPNLWIGWALVAAAWKVLLAKRPGLRTQRWGRFAASWAAAVLAASVAALYWVTVRGTSELSTPQDQSTALLWIGGAALAAGVGMRWAWSRVLRLVAPRSAS